MAGEKLVEFFKAKAEASKTTVNWETRRRNWIRSVNALYDDIENKYLEKAKSSKTVTISRENKAISEEYVGEYTIPVMVLKIGTERVVFSPKGTVIVGASGRIDLLGDMGEVTLIRQPGDRWSVVETRIPTLHVVPLTEESLLTALKSVMRR
jgi:hypothetical protein